MMHIEFDANKIFFFFKVITENQERFVQMLNEPESGSGGGGGVTGQAQGGTTGAGGPPMEGGYIQVTPEEKQAIERVHSIHCIKYSVATCLLAYEEGQMSTVIMISLVQPSK